MVWHLWIEFLGEIPLKWASLPDTGKFWLLVPTSLCGVGRLTLSCLPGKKHLWWGCWISQLHSGCQGSLVCPFELYWKRAVSMQLMAATWRKAIPARPGGFLACRIWPIGHLLVVLETWMWILLWRMGNYSNILWALNVNGASCLRRIIEWAGRDLKSHSVPEILLYILHNSMLHTVILHC